jgi:hypothetical protein
VAFREAVCWVLPLDTPRLPAFCRRTSNLVTCRRGLVTHLSCRRCFSVANVHGDAKLFCKSAHLSIDRWRSATSVSLIVALRILGPCVSFVIVLSGSLICLAFPSIAVSLGKTSEARRRSLKKALGVLEAAWGNAPRPVEHIIPGNSCSVRLAYVAVSAFSHRSRKVQIPARFGELKGYVLTLAQRWHCENQL